MVQCNCDATAFQRKPTIILFLSFFPLLRGLLAIELSLEISIAPDTFRALTVRTTKTGVKRT